MFDKKQNLEISQTEMAVIEAALHTQAKILSIQAGAGGADALNRLNDVKRTLATVTGQKPVNCKGKTAARGFLKMARRAG